MLLYASILQTGDIPQSEFSPNLGSGGYGLATFQRSKWLLVREKSGRRQEPQAESADEKQTGSRTTSPGEVHRETSAEKHPHCVRSAP